MVIDRFRGTVSRVEIRKSAAALPIAINNIQMYKYLIAIAALVAVVLAAQKSRTPSGPDAEYRCRLPDIKCDACRNQVSEELAKFRGIRATRFEGEDRQELVITHAASIPNGDLANALTLVGYPPEAMNGDPSKAVSHAKCVCPMEAAQTPKN